VYKNKKETSVCEMRSKYCLNYVRSCCWMGAECQGKLE